MIHDVAKVHKGMFDESTFHEETFHDETFHECMDVLGVNDL